MDAQKGWLQVGPLHTLKTKSMFIEHIPRSQRPFSPHECLLYYDGPLLFWLPAQDKHLLAIALLEEKSPWPFLIVELSAAQADAVKSNELTLQRATLEAKSWHLLPDYGADELEFVPLSEVPPDWLPGDVTLDG